MAYKGFDDQQLVRLFTQYGDTKALEHLISRHKSRIFTSIYICVKDRYLAEDIFQDTFIKVIDSLQAGSYKEEGKFLPWVLRISHNLCIDHFRRQKRLPGIVDGDGNDIFNYLPFETENKEEALIKEQMGVRVKRLIQMLPDEQREVLVLRHYAEMSFKEIADMTGVSINTALGRMRYALINLRKMMPEKPALVPVNK
jgi:RNA polymerase sigma factor (sigma-70 family)